MLIVVESSHTLTPAGTIGTHSLTVAELPAHSHGRGTTNITGNIYNRPNAESQYWGPAAGAEGCFSLNKDGWNAVGIFANGNTSATGRLHFDAASKWSGTSESKGSGTAHGHSWTGTASTFSLLNPYKCVYCFYRVS